ncbi:MAG TPA: hypothetical protein VM163_14280 [bacterium]|nr:hypothetical protein [bacterium]
MMKNAFIAFSILSIFARFAASAEFIVKGPFELNRANSRFVQPPSGTIQVQIWAEGFTRNVKTLQIRLKFIDKDQNDRVPDWFSIASGNFLGYAVVPQFATGGTADYATPTYFTFEFATAQDLSTQQHIVTVSYDYSSTASVSPYRIVIDQDPDSSFMKDEDGRNMDFVQRDGHFTIGANTWIVDNSGQGDFTTIQACIDAQTTVDGDLVLVQDSGTAYSGSGNRDISLLGKEIILASYPSGDPSNCTINCGGSQSGPHRGFYFNTTGESPNTLLDGFSITGGYVVNTVGADSITDRGSAIYCRLSSPTISNCSIFGNTVRNESAYPVVGGAISIYDSSAIIVDNVVTQNVSDTGSGGALVYGGGISCVGAGSTPWIQDNVISYNSSSDGGGVYSSGGSSPSIINNTIVHNSANMNGGGLLFQQTGVTTRASHNRVEYNTAPMGGAIFIRDAGPTILGNEITYNISQLGAGLCIESRLLDIEAPIISCNSFESNSAIAGIGILIAYPR